MPKIRGTNGNNLLDGTLWDDTIEGLAGDDTLNGLGGDDFLYGDGGNDSLSGGDGDDRLDGGTGDDTLNGGSGNDTATIIAAGGDVTITNTSIVIDNSLFGNDTKSISSIETVIVYGSFANDWIDGSVFSESLRIWSHDGNDTIFGGLGDDLLSSSDGDDIIYGKSGNDTLSSGLGNNYLNGGNGDDEFLAYGENDTVIGGSGFDTLEDTLEQEADTITITDTQLLGSNTLTLSGIELIKVVGISPEQTIDARRFSGQTELIAYEGDDTLLGGQGNDLLLGNLGFDLLVGGAGDDSIRGGGGLDTATFVAKGAFTLTDKSAVGQGLDTLNSIEMVQVKGSVRGQKLDASAFTGETVLNGNAGNDSLLGGTNDDRLLGGADRDNLQGSAGNDTLRGEDGRDTLDGGDGQDNLIGGNDDDVLVGGLGSDTLSSGSTSDRDIFAYADVIEGSDVILDFDRTGNTKDTFRITGSKFTAFGGASALSLGKLPNSQIVGFNGNLGSSAGFRYNQTNGRLFFDGDGGDNSSGPTLLANVRNNGSAVAFGDILGSITVV